jgi:hypothetical protein
MISKKKLLTATLILACAITISIGWAHNKIAATLSRAYSKDLSEAQRDVSTARLGKAQRQDDLLNESGKVRQRIFELRKAKDLSGLVKLADEVEATWPQKSIIYYAGLMIDICGDLSSADFNDDRQYLFLRKYTKQALEKSDQMPIEQEVVLVGFTHGDIEYVLKLVKEENWSNDRTERTKLWCHAWQRIENGIDKNYDVSEHVIPDHKLPAKERQRLRQKDYEQRTLRRIYKEFSQAFERYSVYVYSKKPANTPELRYYLESCVQDAQLREVILTKVENNIANPQ